MAVSVGLLLHSLICAHVLREPCPTQLQQKKTMTPAAEEKVEPMMATTTPGLQKIEPWQLYPIPAGKSPKIQVHQPHRRTPTVR
jgi:hypothetical protein